MKNQGDGQRPQDRELPCRDLFKRREALGALARPDFVLFLDDQCQERMLVWSLISNSSGTPK